MTEEPFVRMIAGHEHNPRVFAEVQGLMRGMRRGSCNYCGTQMIWIDFTAHLKDHHRDLYKKGPSGIIITGFTIEEEQTMDVQMELDEVTGRDLDETRRLLYMVLFDGLQSERWFNLAGTLVNALAHHSQLMGADEAMNDLRAIRAGTETAEHWALPLIKQINQRIASGGQ